MPALLCISSAPISLAAPFVSVSSHPWLPSLHLVSSHPWPPSLRLVSSHPCPPSLHLVSTHIPGRPLCVSSAAVLGCHFRFRQQPSLAAPVSRRSHLWLQTCRKPRRKDTNNSQHHQTFALIFFIPLPVLQPSMAAKNRQPPRRTPPSRPASSLHTGL